MSTIARLALAVVVAVAVTLGVILLGIILISINVGIAEAVGGFLKTYAAAIGVLAGIWFFFKGGNFFNRAA